MTPDHAAIEDLIDFVAAEIALGDIEPWAEIITALDWEPERTAWLVKGYNAYDALDSAWSLVSAWEGPAEWAAAADGDLAAVFACTQERRGLRGGRVLRHLASYAGHVGEGSQTEWIERGLGEMRGAEGFNALMFWTRTIWGVGRQTAFEWVEFLAKTGLADVGADRAAYAQSTGPRRSLERIFGATSPDPEWLEARGEDIRSVLSAAGFPLSVEDTETVICDFNVMRDGRYYPGRHLAALREEVEAIDDPEVRVAWEKVAGDYATIPPGIDRTLLSVYRDTGRMVRI